MPERVSEGKKEEWMDHIIETNKKLTKRWETDVMMTRSHNTPL